MMRWIVVVAVVGSMAQDFGGLYVGGGDAREEGPR